MLRACPLSTHSFTAPPNAASHTTNFFHYYSACIRPPRARPSLMRFLFWQSWCLSGSGIQFTRQMPYRHRLGLIQGKTFVSYCKTGWAELPLCLFSLLAPAPRSPAEHRTVFRDGTRHFQNVHHRVSFGRIGTRLRIGNGTNQRCLDLVQQSLPYA